MYIGGSIQRLKLSLAREILLPVHIPDLSELRIVFAGHPAYDKRSSCRSSSKDRWDTG